MRALVTGAGGFVGGHLVPLLESQGHEVHTFDLAYGDDLRDYERVRIAIERSQPDRIYHLAAQAYVPESTHDPHRGVAVNVGGTLNLLEAVRRTGCRARVHLAGTSEEVGYESQPADRPVTEDAVPCPTTPYGVTKLAAGQLGMVYARLYGIPVIVTRAYNHSGPGHQAMYAIPAFARRIVAVERGEFDRVTHGNLSALRNYTDVRDVVRAYTMAIEAPQGIYNVCSANTVSLQQVLDMLVGLADVEVKTELDEELYRPTVPVFPTPSHAKLTEATGWEPTIPLEQTLRDILTFWRQQR